jgi:ribosomal protein S18 acetylase RimI-like enzyme
METATISVMRSEEAESLSATIRELISGLTYYNERARHEECAKHGARELLAIAAEDPFAILVARVAGDVAGFCITRYDDGLIWVSWFGVLPSHRRKGIGERLLREVAHTMSQRRAHKVWCDTRTANETAKGVLRRVGFEELVTLTNHWYGQDFILWEWYPE